MNKIRNPCLLTKELRTAKNKLGRMKNELKFKNFIERQDNHWENILNNESKDFKNEIEIQCILASVEQEEKIPRKEKFDIYKLSNENTLGNNIALSFSIEDFKTPTIEIYRINK